VNSTNGKRSGRSIAKPGKIRIIGGEYRGRRIAVPERRDLRPTPDRVRETLFNWLGQTLEEKAASIFRGSGALDSRRPRAVPRASSWSRTTARFLLKNTAELTGQGK
jgi:16S rRNA (guanine966-N2)-methyltransferase